MAKIEIFIPPITAMLLAQTIKIITYYIKNKRWDVMQIVSGGGMPSSHTACVGALTTTVGLNEGYSSSLFAITVVFSIIIAYDAMNVRFYSGQNIKLTKQLINDINDKKLLDLLDPIYNTKMKDALGHRTIEVIAGAILGFILSITVYYLF